MSFNDQEFSIASGRPVRLYLFERGVQRWGYCTADRNMTYAGVDYRSAPVSDNGRRYTGEPQSDAFEVTVSADNEVAALFRGVGPSSEITLTVRDIHYGAIESDAPIRYIGSITAVRRIAQDRSKIICQSSDASIRQTGLRMTWGRGCQYELYGRGCWVNRDLFRDDVTIQNMNGTTISNGFFETQPDGWWSGGYVEWPVGPGIFERRGIELHAAGTLTLLGGTDGLMPNQTVTVYAGCNRLINTCHDKFGNADNYPGAPHMPGISPFEGNSLF